MASKALTPRQIEIIKACVPILKDHGKTITSTFYRNMLNDHKELNNVFNQTHQITGHQAQALAGAVFAYASNIDNLGALAPAVELIAHKHCSLFIRPEQYDIVGTHLLAAMKQVLGDALTPEIHDAWAAAYWQLAKVFIDREKAIYDTNEGWTDWKDFVIDKKVKESDEITSFYLKPKDGKPLPTFLPGQYISIQIRVPGLEYLQARQYSLSTAPNKGYFRISVKREKSLDPNDKKNPGWISNCLHDKFKEGDSVSLSHPGGDFFLDTKKSGTSPLVLMSAGVGLTPLLSMLETLCQEDSKRQISWIHAARDGYVQAFNKHINELIKNRPNIHSTVFHQNPKEGEQGYHYKGMMDLDKLNKEKDLFLNDKNSLYYVCGPIRFMYDMRLKLLGFGVNTERINYEVFGTGGMSEVPADSEIKK